MPSPVSGNSLTVPLLLALASILLALGVVYVKHQNRLLTTEVERLRTERDRLDMEGSQLQLEEAALAHHARIETLARDQLGMSEPRDYVVVEQPKKTLAAPLDASPDKRPR
ncbi:MAG: ftsL [Hydrocarboniphaga sp.]|uniref:cell division protein FtsL n=1 Tax=Hydrocarboniphaga sp. TaxID=2033016 RepID=UPI00262594A8|nr:cell division protein FtsL [Hydrocarboniphaga sp.]MDB5969573.1 ftsL [Hydrocarboniphaga sp.]